MVHWSWIIAAVLAIALAFMTAAFKKARRERKGIIEGRLVSAGLSLQASQHAYLDSWNSCLSKLEEACQSCFMVPQKVGDNGRILDYFVAHQAGQEIMVYLDPNSPDGKLAINSCFRSYLPSSPLRKAAGEKLIDQSSKLLQS